MNDYFNWWGGAKYADYMGITPLDDKKIRWYDAAAGQPLPALSDWTPPTLRQYLGEPPKLRKPRKIGDAPNCGPVNLISARAAELLAPIWAHCATLYPVLLEDAPGETYFMVVCSERLGWDCLDERTVYAKQLGDQIYAVKEWHFIPARVGERDLFLLPHSSTHYFVSKRFVEAVQAAKLKGFRFDATYLDPKPIVT